MYFDLITVTKYMLIIMPLVDTLNGVWLGDAVSGVNPGQIYRSTLLLILIFVLLKNNIMSVNILFVFISMFFLVGMKMFLDLYVNLNEIGVIIKLFLPVFIIEILSIYFSKNQLEGYMLIKNVLDRMSILAPITIILPYVMGVGNSTYEEGVGFKGFYYATNEISFLIATLIIFLLFEFRLNVIWILKFTLCIITAFLIGTKSVLLLAVICLLLIFVKLIKRNEFNWKYKSFVIVAPILIVMWFFYDIYNQFEPILNRWEYGLSMHEAEGVLFFLTSGRTARVEEAWNMWSSSSIETILLGWGLSSDLAITYNCEMDCIDLLFAVGLFIFYIITLYYIRFAKCICKTDKNMLIVCLCLFVLIFFGGHVIYAGLGGMALGILLLYLYFYKNQFDIHKYKDYKEVCNEKI